jgi:methyl-accepting chemotaxis protein
MECAMFRFKNLSILNKIILPVSIFTITAISIMLYLLISQEKEILEERADKSTQELAGGYGKDIKLKVDDAINAAQHLAYFIGENAEGETLDRQVLDRTLKKFAQTKEHFYGVYAAVLPDKLDGKDDSYKNDAAHYDETGQYIPYFYKDGGTIKSMPLKDYQSKHWFKQPRNLNGVYVAESYYTEYVDKRMTTISYPIYKNSEFIGVAGVDITLDIFKDMIEDIKPYQTGYAYLVDHSGQIIAHPKDDYMGTDVYQYFDQKNELKNAVSGGKIFTEEKRNVKKDNALSRYVMVPIDLQGTDNKWSFGLSIPMEKVLAEANNAVTSGIWLGVVVVLLLVGIIAVIAKIIGSPIKRLQGEAERISKGEIDKDIEVDRNDEIGKLAHSIKIMVDKIKQSLKEAEDKGEAAEKAAQEAKTAQERAQQQEEYLSVNTKKILTEMEKFAQGDLTVHVEPEKDDDDIGRLFRGFNKAVANIKEMILQVTNAVQATASASNQISSSSEELAAGAQEQSSQASEIASAVEQMTKTIQENTKNAGSAADLAKQAGTNAEEGGYVVKETVEGMKNVAEVVSNAASRVKELGENTDQIGEIIQVIDEIADQTNLLALNAAIEAARAGEEGRGFAVVADEVRKLAERTTKATKEIADKIKQIQEGTSGVVESIEKGSDEAEKGREYANKAGDSLSQIINGSKQVVDAVTQVAGASEEQSSTSEEISKNIESISSVTQQSASGTEQIARAAEDLNRLTDNLQNLINNFKVGQDSQNRETGVSFEKEAAEVAG